MFALVSAKCKLSIIIDTYCLHSANTMFLMNQHNRKRRINNNHIIAAIIIITNYYYLLFRCIFTYNNILVLTEIYKNVFNIFSMCNR